MNVEYACSLGVEFLFLKLKPFGVDGQHTVLHPRNLPVRHFLFLPQLKASDFLEEGLNSVVGLGGGIEREATGCQKSDRPGFQSVFNCLGQVTCLL